MAAKLFKKLVGAANGGVDVHFVKPEYVLSTDDTTIYIFAGADKNGNGTWILANPEDMTESGTHSLYSPSDVNNMNGFRVKPTYTLTAGGQIAPIFITVYVSEKEMPAEKCPSGVLFVTIPGLAVGSDIDPNNSLPGYIVFLRKTGDSSLDKRKHKLYRDKILLPFVERLRQFNDGYVTGTDIPIELTVVSWSDGDLAQMAVTKDEEQMEINEKKRIISNKQSAARTGTEQGGDLWTGFRGMKRDTKITTCETMTPLKREATEMLDELEEEGKVNLPPPHKAALVDFVATHPGSLQKHATKEKLQQAFIENGMIDESTLQIPDLHRIICTCRRKLSEQEVDNFIKQFPSLLQIWHQTGIVTDDVLEQHGLPIDVDRNGNEVRRTATISGEHLQRAKCFSHRAQRNLRQEQLDQQLRTAQEKVAKARVKHQNKYLLNAECEKLLQKALRQKFKLPDDAALVSWDEVTMEMLAHSSILVRFLTAFIEVRTGVTDKLPSKGKLHEAQAGARNLIWLAHECRSRPVIPQTETQPMSEAVVPTFGIPELQYDTYDASPLSLGKCQFLVTDDWLSKMKRDLNPEQMIWFEDCPAVDIQPQVDKLMRIMWSRLQKHIDRRLTDEKKRRHWVWNFVRENLGQMAAIMLMQGHIRDNLDAVLVRDDLSLLRSPKSKGSKMILLSDSETGIGTSAALSLQGCYLHYDPDDGFIRSGKATSSGKSFESRLKQHFKSAKLLDQASTKSTFYTSYPSKEAKVNTLESRKAFYEDLEIYCGTVFDNGTDPSSLFHWSNKTTRQINKLSWKGETYERKCLHMTGYLMELAYDLCIPPALNVSRNPCFEIALGVWQPVDRE